jgi:UDP-N-acetylglucosamine 4,6-dehydratase
VRSCLDRTNGGEVWIPKLPTFRVNDMRQAAAPLAGWDEVGIRQGEKLHESMISEDEAPFTYDCGDRFAICPPIDGPLGNRIPEGATRVPDGFVYRSDQGPHLTVAELKTLLGEVVGKAA